MLDELMPLQVYYFGGVNLVRTLVLTVDRDNDLGIKTAIRGPVIG